MFNSGGKDKALLMELMSNSLQNKHALADVNKFEDKELAKTYNEFFERFINGNNKNALDLNNAMNIVGNIESLKKMLETVGDQKDAVVEVDSSLNELSDILAVNSTAIDKIYSYVDKAYNYSLKSVKDVNESMSFVDDSFNQIDSITAQVRTIQGHIGKVNEVVSSVKNIAQQVNMLAINASIEAARAGVAGKGFAVVAEEVRRLAGITTKSAESINENVDVLYKDVNGIISNINKTTGQLKKGKELVGHTVTEIGDISSNMQSINSQINEVFDLNKKQNIIITGFVDMVKKISESSNDLFTYCNETGSDLYKISRAVDSVRGNVARKQANLSAAQWIAVYRTDHVIFTWRLYNMIAGFETLKIEMINNHKTCKLGLWYYAVTDSALKNNRDFIEIDVHHNKLHQYAVECVTACNEKKYDKAMAKFNEATNVLKRLDECLLRIERTVQH